MGALGAGELQAAVHCLAWLSDDAIKELVTKAPAGTRFIFKQMGGDDETAAKWLAKGRALSAKANC